MRPDDLGQTWKALADPTRRGILDRLRGGPQTTGALSAGFPELSRFAIMKHLGVLVDVGLVLVRRRGRERWNYLNAVPLQQIHDRWLGPYEAHWAAALLRLKRRAEAHGGGSVPMPETTETTQGIRTIVIEQEVEIAASAERVFEALTGDISSWWGAPYLFSSDRATALVIEPTVGGRFVERWGNDTEGGLWATVTEYKQNERLELTGRMAMRGALGGLVQVTLEPHGDSTTIKLSHRAIGEISEETQTGYAGGWSDLLGTRLKGYVEDGTVSGVAA